MESYKQRLHIFETVTDSTRPAYVATNHSEVDNWSINLNELRRLCKGGIPDKPGIRATCWKLLLGVLPLDKRQWHAELAQKRQDYYDFVKDLVVDPGISFPRPDQPKKKALDHPLDPDPNSQWSVYFQDNAILEQIDMDVRRTLSDMAFFQLPVNSASPQFRVQQLSNDTHNPPLPRKLSDVPSLISDNSSNLDSPPKPTPLNLSPLKHAKSLSTPISPFHPRSAPWQCVSEEKRRSLFKRLENVNSDIGMRERPQVSPKIQRQRSSSHSYISPSIQALASSSAFKRRQSIDPVTLSNCSMSTPSSIPTITETPVVQDLHWEALERILFIYAKLNPGVGYVQGMNELLGPLYYICANDSSDSPLDGLAHAEADAFYLFTQLMSGQRDQFVRLLDYDKSVGVNASLQEFSIILKQVCPEVHQDFEYKQIDLAYFAFRWITVLGTQEFPLPEVIRLWDTLFSHVPLSHFQELQNPTISPLHTMIQIGVAMVCLIRDELIEGSFVDNIKCLQNYPLIDIGEIIFYAFQLEALPEHETLQGLMNNGNNQNQQEIATTEEEVTTKDRINELTQQMKSFGQQFKDKHGSFFNTQNNSLMMKTEISDSKSTISSMWSNSSRIIPTATETNSITTPVKSWFQQKGWFKA